MVSRNGTVFQRLLDLIRVVQYGKLSIVFKPWSSGNLKKLIGYMYFLVDVINKIIFGWSPKCGCSHIKTIYWFLQTNNIVNSIHTTLDINQLPDDIENYTTIIIIRNPYETIVSGFLDKYRIKGQYRCLWTAPSLSFNQFVDKLIEKDWSIIDKHQFEPQTHAMFDKKITRSKIFKIYDIHHIDYEYIEQLYNKKIPEIVLNTKQGHERHLRIKKQEYLETYIYDLHIDEYFEYNIHIKHFYNEEIKEKVFNFYRTDFTFFEENGINYMLRQ